MGSMFALWKLLVSFGWWWSPWLWRWRRQFRKLFQQMSSWISFKFRRYFSRWNVILQTINVWEWIRFRRRLEAASLLWTVRTWKNSRVQQTQITLKRLHTIGQLFAGKMFPFHPWSIKAVAIFSPKLMPWSPFVQNWRTTASTKTCCSSKQHYETFTKAAGSSSSEAGYAGRIRVSL